MNELSLCFKNLENMDVSDSIRKSHFVDTLTDSLFSISNQLNTTFSKTDHTDYIKSFLSDESNREFLSSEFIDENKFLDSFIRELNERVFEFLGIDISSKKIIFQDFPSKDIIKKIYYASYLNVVLKQDLIIKVLYTIFSYITSKQLEQIENVLGRKIEKKYSKLISKKYKLRNTNYIMDLNEIITCKEDISKIILNTNLFEKHLQNGIYYTDSMPIDYTYEIFFRQASRDEIDTLFRNLFKYDENLSNCINNIEVYAINRNFDIRRYGDGRGN